MHVWLMGWDNSASEKVLGRSVMVFFFWGIHEKSMGKNENLTHREMGIWWDKSINH